MVHFDDDTYGIVDFKTSNIAKTSGTYARQLHAYAAALRNPAPGCELKQCDISDLSLVVFTPQTFHTPIDDTQKHSRRHVLAALTGNLTYLKIPQDEQAFLTFLASVLDVLTLPEPPAPPRSRSSRNCGNISCPYCQFLSEATQRGYVSS